MKNKWLWVVVIVLLLLAIGAVGYYKFAHKENPQNTMMGTEEHGGIFGSIQDALTKHLSLQCQFTSDDGSKTTAYIKNGAIRVDTNVGKQNAASMIMKDRKIYFWQVAQKTGTIITQPSITMTPIPTSSTMKVTGTSEEQNEGSDALSTLEKFKNSCKVANVADSLFTPPADVKFTDVSEMMKTAAPSGVVPSGVSQEDVQKMMQQYQAPTGY